MNWGQNCLEGTNVTCNSMEQTTPLSQLPIETPKKGLTKTQQHFPSPQAIETGALFAGITALQRQSCGWEEEEEEGSDCVELGNDSMRMMEKNGEIGRVTDSLHSQEENMRDMSEDAETPGKIGDLCRPGDFVSQVKRLEDKLFSLSQLLNEKEQRIQVLTIENTCLSQRIGSLATHNSLQQKIQALQIESNQVNPPKTIIKEVPVYIQKERVIEVAVPIYIKQQPSQSKFHQLAITHQVFQEENSFAINELSQHSEGNSESRKSNFKFNSKSFKQSDIEDKSSIMQMDVQKTIKQIVEVPVYIEKQVIVEKEVVVQKEVVVEKEVIRYIRGQQQAEMRSNSSTRLVFDDQGRLVEASNGNDHFQIHKTTSVCLPHASILEQSQQSERSEETIREIIIEVPVEVEKQVIVYKEIIVTVEIPVEILVEVPKEIEKEVIVEKEVVVQKEVLVEKIIQKIVPHEIIVQKIIGSLSHSLDSCQDLKIQQKLPQEIAFHFDLADHLAIQKILVSQNLLTPYDPSSTAVKEFIEADYMFEGLIDILEVPVEIMLDAPTKEVAEMAVQTEELQQTFVPQQSRVEIIIEKIIYVNDQQDTAPTKHDPSIFGLRAESEKEQKRDQLIIERIVEIEKPIYVQRNVQVMKVVEIEKIVQVEKIVQIEKIIQIQKVRQVEKREEIEKVLYQFIPFEVPFVIVIQPPTIQDSQRQLNDLGLNLSEQQQIDFSEQSPQININPCLQLTDRSSPSEQPEREYSDCHQYALIEEQPQFSQLQEQGVGKYQQECQILQEELKALEDRLDAAVKENQALTKMRKEMQEQNKSLLEVIEQLERNYKERIQQQVQSIIQTEEINQIKLHDELTQMQHHLNQVMDELRSKEATIIHYQHLLRQTEQQRDQQNNELIKQIQLKDVRIEDLLYENHNNNEQLQHLRHRQAFLLQEYSKIESELQHVKRELLNIRQTENDLQIEAELKVMDLINGAENLKIECELKLAAMQQLYRAQIQQMTKKNADLLGKKETEIQQLLLAVEQLQNKKSKQREGKSQKINVKIINMPNQSPNISNERAHQQFHQQSQPTQRQQGLITQNKRLIEIIENLNRQICDLNNSNHTSIHLPSQNSSERHRQSEYIRPFATEQDIKRGEITRSTTRIKIQQINKAAKCWETVPRKCMCGEQELSRKNNEISELKILIQSYQAVIRTLEDEIATLQQKQEQLITSFSNQQEYQSQQYLSQSTVQKYQTYRVRYYKILQTAQLIREEVTRIEQLLPYRSWDLLTNIKRFLQVIEMNRAHAWQTPENHRVVREQRGQGNSRRMYA